MSFLVGVLLQVTATIAAADGGLVVRAAWIRAAAPNTPVLAGYMTIENHSPGRKSLIGATSLAFGSVMIHRTEHVDGVARMSHMSKVDIAPNGKLVFQPDGYHLMLMQPKRLLRPGDQVSMELRFADGSRASAVFAVREREQMEAQGQKGRPHADH